jgi:hypothetical protein
LAAYRGALVGSWCPHELDARGRTIALLFVEPDSSNPAKPPLAARPDIEEDRHERNDPSAQRALLLQPVSRRELRVRLQCERAHRFCRLRVRTGVPLWRGVRMLARAGDRGVLRMSGHHAHACPSCRLRVQMRRAADRWWRLPLPLAAGGLAIALLILAGR